MSRDPTCVFEVDAGLIDALDSTFGPPIDSYVMGWQVWIEPAGEGVELEYRLHPPAGFTIPEGLSPEDLWDQVTSQLPGGELRLGEERRTLDQVWVLLEVYPAFGDPATPEQLRSWAEAALGRPALASGYVDHARLGGGWERRPGRFDLPSALREALGS
ncbi:MAG: hypothetical protein M3N51_06810 [Actinomycetota bacterium]|nr:hypothetical protein [Actinomycetota bacterium]